MSDGLLALLAFIPILTILVLMARFRWPATRAMPVSFAITLVLALSIWGMPANWIGAAILSGLAIAADILLIVMGALAVLFTLRESGAIAAINKGFTRISPDKRVQAIIIAWLFGSFLEGTAGFGTPAALAAPLLLSLGFPALAAVMVALIANTTAVSFGAIGTPTLIGIGTSLNLPTIEAAVETSGLTYDAFIRQVGLWTSMLHMVPGIFVPLIMTGMLTRFFGKNKSLREGLRIWPFALFAGASFVIPYVLVAAFLGPEFPSIFGGLAGLLIVIPATRRGFLVPRKTWDFDSPEKWKPTWTGAIKMDAPAGPPPFSLRKAWIPYVLIGLLLIITRLRALPIGEWLAAQSLDASAVFGTTVDISLDRSTTLGCCHSCWWPC